MFRSARTRTMASVGILLCLGVISSQGQPSGDTNKGEATSKDADADKVSLGGAGENGETSGDTNKGEVTSEVTDKGEASAVDTDVADEVHLSSTELSAEVGLTIKFDASSSWSNSYNPSKAVRGGYWCTNKRDPAPYWWISFVAKPIEVVSIAFEEKYPGAVFEFFASSGEECAKPKDGTVLINGTQEEISNIKFKNGRRYHCYGLRITKPAQTKRYGALATLKNFQLTIHREDDCNEQSCSGNGDCTDGVFKKTCVCAVGFDGKDCETEVFGGGKYFNNAGSKYILFEKKTTWETANRWCQRLGRGWYPASMPTREEFDQVATKLQKLRSGSANSCHDSWIGLTYDNNWYWFHGEPPILASDDGRWSAGEPQIDHQANVDYNDRANVGFIRVKGSQGKILTANRKSTKLCSFLCVKRK